MTVILRDSVIYFAAIVGLGTISLPFTLNSSTGCNGSAVHNSLAPKKRQ